MVYRPTLSTVWMAFFYMCVCVACRILWIKTYEKKAVTMSNTWGLKREKKGGFIEVCLHLVSAGRFTSVFIHGLLSYQLLYHSNMLKNFDNFWLICYKIGGKIQVWIEVTGRRGRRRRKLLDDFKERRGYTHLKEEALDRIMWRARFRRDFGPVVRQTTKWMNVTKFLFWMALSVLSEGLLSVSKTRLFVLDCQNSVSSMSVWFLCIGNVVTM
jgi:hypothetical protein